MVIAIIGILVSLLLPMEQVPLHDRWNYMDFNANTFSTTVPGRQWLTDGSSFMGQVVRTFICPSNPGGTHNENAPAVTTGSGAPGVHSRGDYFGSAGTYGYPGYHAALPSLWNPFGPGSANPAPPPGKSHNGRGDGMFNRNVRYSFADVLDGTSNTLMFGERAYHDPVFDSAPGTRIRNWGWVWFGAEGNIFLGTSVPINFRMPAGHNMASPDPLLYNNRINAYGSMHPGAAQVALTDGSVRFVPQTISPITFRAMGTRAGGEVADIP